MKTGRKPLSLSDEQFRELVVQLDGNQAAIADVMGITRVAISNRLGSVKHGSWWAAFKKRRALKRRRTRERKCYLRGKERHQEALAAQAAALRDPVGEAAKDFLDSL